MAVDVLARDEEVPICFEGDAGGKGGDEHEDVGGDDDGHEDLAGEARPLEGEDVDIEEEDRELREEERQEVHNNSVPGGLRGCVSA